MGRLFSARAWLWALGLALLGLAGAPDALAQGTPAPSPQVSMQQQSIIATQQLYCETKSLLEGNFGLALGLLLAAFGLWGLIQGGSLFGGIVMIVMGALVTAIPGLVESFLGGLGNLMHDSRISSNGGVLNLPTCRRSLP